MGFRMWHIGVVGASLLALGACSQATSTQEVAVTPTGGGGLQFAVTKTCTPGSVPACQAVGGEHVLVTPSSFVAAGVTDASLAADDPSAVDVVFDADGAQTLGRASGQVAKLGDVGRLVLRVDGQVVSAVRVPSAVEATTMRVVIPAPLTAGDVARQLRAR